jgi:hypothetical protein
MTDRPSITLVSFLLTVKGKGQRPELVVECHAHRQADIESFESMDEGSLVGVIGTLRPIQEQHAHTIVRLNRLELLGKPQTGRHDQHFCNRRGDHHHLVAARGHSAHWLLPDAVRTGQHAIRDSASSPATT